MRVPFRGVTTREVALLEGPAGWGEFGPFLEYAPPEASRWLASAVESAWVRLARCRARLGAGQRDGAGGRTGAGGRGAGAVPRVHDGQGQGGRARPVAGRRPRPGRGGARGDGAVGEGARRRQRRLVGRRRARGAGAARRLTTWSTPSSPARRSRSCATCGCRWRATASTCRSPPTSRSARPRTRCGCATSRPPTSSSSRWRRWAGCGPRSRSSRPAGCPRWCRRRSTPASASRPGSRSPPRCRSLEHACGLGTVALLDGDVGGHAARAGGRRAAGRPGRRRPRAASSSYAAPPDRVAWWRERVTRVRTRTSREGDR